MDREPTVTKRHPALGECERLGVNKPPSRPSAPEPEAGSNSSRGFVSLPWAVGVNEDTPRDGFHSETGPGENASYICMYVYSLSHILDKNFCEDPNQYFVATYMRKESDKE